MVFVYIIECADNTFYTGIAADLPRRIRSHERGLSVYTKSRLPVKLVYKERLASRSLARERELQIKKWSKKKKLALIESRKEDLPVLSKKEF